MIQSFADKETQELFETGRSRRFSSIARAAVRKLTQLDVVKGLDDLKVPPGNRLEALKGDRETQFSIRINDQFRICFRWLADGPVEVEVTDYHS